MAFARSPCFHSTEITFVLPAATDLWEAQDPETWRTLYLTRRQYPEAMKPTLLDVISDPSMLRSYHQEFDCELSLFVAIHCLWPQQLAFLDAKRLHQGSQISTKPGHSCFWLEAQRHELYTRLKDLNNTLKSFKSLTAQSQIVSELFMMTLFISPVDVEKLAGRFGVAESRSILSRWQAWSESEELRYARWHAGQVLRASRFMEPKRLLGFFGVAVYQACLTLASKFLIDILSQASARASPTPESVSGPATLRTGGARATNTLETDLIALDGPDNMHVKTYLLTGQGIPALSLGGQSKPLSDVNMIPLVMAEIFKSNHSSTTDQLPPLLEKLLILVGDLMRLAEKSNSSSRQF